MNEENDEWVMRLLRSALRHIAADPDEQVRRLSELGHGNDADDLAESLNHAYHAAIRRHMLTADQANTIAAIDQLFGQMSGAHDARLWTQEALAAEPRWARARALAIDALRLLPDGPSEPERVIRG